MTEQINFGRLCKIIESYKGKEVAITFHSIGDRDGVASAQALAEYLEGATIATPDFITRSAERMLHKLGYKKITNRDLGNPDAIIVLDTNTLDALGSMKGKIQDSTAQVLFIDHHIFPKAPYKSAIIFNDESYTSTTSIIYEVLKQISHSPSKNVARLMLYGIIADSAEFKNATSLTFRQISELLGIIGSEYEEIIYDIDRKPPPQIRADEISDIFKSTVEINGDYVIIYGETKMHASEVAEMAMGLGADIALFWRQNKEEASISARMAPNLDKKLSLHLGRLMQDAGPILEGSGGGHPCAAGAYGPNIKAAKDAVSKILSEIKGKMA
ncbi:MAG: DHH family phosphoesterase [Candidatus Micrarchaeota archaeon]|nr:DHH family phosphoesterase [Candidatus Micrarchaeota archaeon]MDE1834454.1 DHH family phosphoesterase [Candidatus Micrarchaeota archaeon]MDE1859072.1 DHH family phosphoesterase [Candidatus Micrarchaeota archaeon]